MKIAICGSGIATDQEVIQSAHVVGKAAAREKAVLLTGAGAGYPYEAAKACFIAGGTVIGISPAASKQEHISVFKFPADAFTQMEYTGMGIPARNFPLVKEADAIIIIGGQIGSLNEFTIAFHYKKPIGVLTGSGGITMLLGQIADICNKTNEKGMMLYSQDPMQLVSKVVAKLKDM